ncbi:MAG: hypothetical protein ACSHX3_07735 [Litorimonas sp.]
MQWQSIGRMSLVSGAAMLLSGCLTPKFEDAQPEKYVGYDCEQLNLLSESYRASPQDLLLEEDPSELERTNRRNISSLFGQRAGDRPINAQEERDRRSIALARRQKGCQ